MVIEIQQKTDTGTTNISSSSSETKLPSDSEFVDRVRRGLAEINGNQPESKSTSSAASPSELEQSVGQLRKIDLKSYFDAAKTLAPRTSTQAINLYLEYALHYSEKCLSLQADPLSTLTLTQNAERIDKLNTRMQAIHERLTLLGIPTNGIQTLTNKLDNLIGNNSTTFAAGTSRASLVIDQAPKLVAEITQLDPISFGSRVTTEMSQTHQVLDPLAYYYGGRGSIAASQLRDPSSSRFDRSNEPLASRHAGRNFRSRKDENLSTKIDCSHYAHFQRQSVARAANMPEDWIRKNITYKDSYTLTKQGCMSVKKALATNQFREGDVLVYPGHAGVVGRDKNGALCIMESTSGINSRTGKYESGVQISDFNTWINRRINKPTSKFVVYRDRIPGVA